MSEFTYNRATEPQWVYKYHRNIEPKTELKRVDMPAIPALGRQTHVDLGEFATSVVQ